MKSTLKTLFKKNKEKLGSPVKITVGVKFNTFKRTGRTMRIALSNPEKELIHKYWFVATESIKIQLTNKRRKTVDIPYEEIKDLVGFLSLECNHCKSKQLSFELNALCEKLEQFF